MQIVEIKNPFQRHVRRIKLVEHNNQTVEVLLKDYLEEVLEKYGVGIDYNTAKESFQVVLNGLVIPSALWDQYKPRPNDQIIFMPIVAKSGDSKQILNLAIMIVAVAFVGPAFAGNVLHLAEGTVGYALAVAAVGAGTGLLLSSMLPQPSKGLSPSDWEDSQIFGWNPQTTQQQGIVQPCFYGRNKLHGNCVAVHTEIDDGDDTKQKLKMLVALGTGPIEGIVEGSITINDQPSDNYENVTTEERRGLIDQTAISFFDSIKPEYKTNRIVSYGSPVTYTTPDDDFDDLEIELIFPRGLYHANNSGGISESSMDIKVEISVADAESWSTLVDTTITDDTTASKRVCYTTGVAYPGGSSPTVTQGNRYDIKVTKGTAEKSSARYGDELRLVSVREVIEDAFTYPRTALLGISALASDQISGGVDVSCIAKGKIVNVYDGADWTLQYSNNPAWVLWDIFTRPVISGDGSSGDPYVIERYDGMTPSKMDLVKFWELAQWCDVDTIDDGEGGTEKRITFNGGWDTESNVWKAAEKVCQVARCNVFFNGSEITLAIDKAADPVQLFTVSNIDRDSWEETFLPQSDLASEIEVQYRDISQDYERVPFTVVDSSNTNYNNKVTLELFGVTKQSEAWRAAMFRLLQNRYLKSTIKFGVDIDAVACTLGDVIQVQHDVHLSGTGGRVQSGTTLSFVADKDLVYESGYTYTVVVRKNDDTLNTRTCSSKYNSIIGVDSTQKQFQVDGDYSDEYKDGDSIRIADSDSNDGDYTLNGDATYADSVTTITVNETIPDDTVIDSGNPTDGGLFNLRRVVVTAAFKDEDDNNSAPESNDIYSWGKQDLHAEEYRIIKMERDGDQKAIINAIEYNELVYGMDSDTPIIPISNYSPPGTDKKTSLVLPTIGDLEHRWNPNLMGLPVVDIPLTHNLKWNNAASDAPTTVSWEAEDGVNPILVTYKGCTYEITAGSSNQGYIYWDPDSPSVFSGTSSSSTVWSIGAWIMAMNESGAVYPAFGMPVINAMILTVSQLSALAADMGTITSGSITLSLGGDTRLRIDSNGLYVSNNAGSSWDEIIYNDSGDVTLAAHNLVVANANIGALAVGTDEIQDDATQVYGTAETSGESGWVPGYDQTALTAQSITETSLGGLVEIFASMNIHNYDASSHYCVVEIYRDATCIYGPVNTETIAASGEINWNVSVVDSPGSGSVTYYMKIRDQNTGTPEDHKVNTRMMVFRESKGK